MLELIRNRSQSECGNEEGKLNKQALKRDRYLATKISQLVKQNKKFQLPVLKCINKDMDEKLEEKSNMKYTLNMI